MGLFHRMAENRKRRDSGMKKTLRPRKGRELPARTQPTSTKRLVIATMTKESKSIEGIL